jgi:SAM-dependent methyltransferase
MSSPIAKQNKSFFDNILIGVHRKTSHSKRIEVLSSLFAGIIESLNPEDRIIRLLDVGCGDMSIARKLASKYGKLRYTCIDIYPNIQNWENYLEFDGMHIPFNDKEFDVVLFSEVLHHDIENAKNLLIEAKRVSNFILIKDHFEYGSWSGRMLQLADFIGNYGYGVTVPKHYFSKQSFSELLFDCQLKEIECLCPVELYQTSLIIKLVLKSKYQFISLLK